MTKRFTNHVRKGLALFSTMLFFSIPVLAQNQVSGTITDTEDGSPLPGVSVILKGTTSGTITDASGNFNIAASSSDVLVFSYIGYSAQEVTVGNQTSFNIGLNSEAAELQELVVTGYSVDSRRETTGSVSTIKPRALQIAPSGNVEQQLQGRVAGVTVITNGQPGTESKVRIRGFGALGGNQPLYIVDGVPVNSTDFLSPADIETTTVLKDATAAAVYGARAAGGVIVYTTNKGKKGGGGKPTITYDSNVGFTTPDKAPGVLNPQEQADFTWLAISNAARQIGQDPTFNHPQYGTGSTPVLPQYLLAGGDSGASITAADVTAATANYNVDYGNGGIVQLTSPNLDGTDWYDAITRNAFLQRHNIGISGGGDGSRYFIGLGAQQQQGIIKRQEFNRYTFRINSEFDIIPNKLRIGENVQTTYRSVNILLGDGNGGGQGSSDDANLILDAFRMSPIIPVYDDFGGYAGTAASGFNNPRNPVANIDGQKNNKNFSVEAFGNVYLELEPVENLVLRTSFGGRYQNFTQINFTRHQYENSENNGSFGFNNSTGYTSNWVWTNTADYKKSFGQHTIGVLIGQEALNFNFFNNNNNIIPTRSIQGSGLDPFLETPDFVTLNTVGTPQVNGFHSNGVNFSSVFGRLTYDFDSKYLATVVLRRDGSSVLGKDVRHGTFPAFSAAWRLSEEDFMSGVSVIDDLKLRVGYGIVGNVNNVNPSNQFSLFGTTVDQSSYDIGGSNGGANQGFFLSGIGNSIAKWEKAKTTNIGFDALFLDGRLDVVIDFWKKTTEDLLFQLPISTERSAFAEAPFINVGEMENKGIDLKVVAKGNVNSVRYEVTFNGSVLKNEIVKLAPGIEDLPNRSSDYRGITPVLNQVGQPLSAFYGYKVQGLFEDVDEVERHATQEGAAPGRFRFEDINGDDVINSEDRTTLGNPIPDFTGGLTVKLNYKNWELEMYAFALLGNEIYNVSKVFTDFYPLFPGAAISSRVKDAWSFDNRRASIPIFENVSNFSTNTQSNSFYVEDGSYLRMQNVTLSYIFPNVALGKLGMERLKVSASANNLFTITGYSGLDPGVGGDADTNFGIDLGNFPVTRSYNLGVSLAF